MKIGYQGVEGAFSYIASKQIFPNEEYISFKTFFDVLDAIEKDKIDCGVLPIENSYAGRVAGMHNLFKDFCDKKLFITNEKMLKVEHCLCGVKGSKIENITHIFSHEQALMQCQKNISKFLPTARSISKENTAISAQFVAENKNTSYASICSKDACDKYGLQVLKEDFQDSNDNYTLFISLSKTQNKIQENTKNVLTSMIFELKNKSGALYHSLECFAKENIDLVKIESYIPATSSSSAMFFITTRSNIEDENMIKAIKKLKEFTNNIYIFGSYFGDKKRFY